MKGLNNAVHIVSFDVPYPADYGGVIDIFYKIKALHERGIQITLHCFEYGRERSKKLHKYCDKVYYYKRNSWKNPFLNSLPYIVCTRNSSELLNNLLKDDSPILFEGLHSTFFLKNPELRKRRKVVRMHNVEHHYYKNLEKVESNFFRKYFYRIEADKLKKYQSQLKYADAIAAISKPDTVYLRKWFKSTVQVSAFHPNEEVQVKAGMGKFAYYHGNLSVGENNFAALFLVKKVFNNLDIPLIIAGKHPSDELVRAVEENPNVTLKKNVSSEKIMKMIEEAQINVLPTFQNTGIKLKLLNALYLGRHCVVTPDMVENTGLEELCVIGKNAKELKARLKELFVQEFDQSSLSHREEKLTSFGNYFNAEKLIELLEIQPVEAIS